MQRFGYDLYMFIYIIHIDISLRFFLKHKSKQMSLYHIFLLKHKTKKIILQIK